MPARTPPPIDNHDLHALVDGQLAADRAQAVRDRLGASDAAQLAQWQAQRERLRTLHAAMAQEPLPEPLRSTADRLQARHDRQARAWHLGGMAASVLLAFGLGWTLHGQWPLVNRSDPASMASAQRFAQQAAVAHAVYQPEQRHPVEVAAAQQEHLVQWLSKRLGRPLTLPVLTQQGFELVGGRLLPGESGARAQFMYQNPAGQRITLYLGALDGTPGTAFHLYTGGPVPAFYWLDQGFGYALSGPLERDALLALATAVHRQL
ncbi:MAG: anti-sigma factor [Giesbergeria sp.]|jgi:anti-sigma factor RsiW|nr:anti-sigma factor [Giesbergeria sp.]